MNALRTGLIATAFFIEGALTACAVTPYEDVGVGYYGGVYAPYGYEYGGWGGGYRVGPPRGGEHGDYRGGGPRPGGPGGGHGGGGHGGGAPGIPSGPRGGGGGHH